MIRICRVEVGCRRNEEERLGIPKVVIVGGGRNRLGTERSFMMCTVVNDVEIRVR